MPEHATVRTGLITAGDVQVPLDGVAIAAEISSFCARVTVTQRYVNREAQPIEAVYVFPLDEGAAVCGFQALIDGTLANARALGVDRALTGPITRGDAGTLHGHLTALRAHAPDVLDLYRAAAEREIAIALRRGALSPERAEALRSTLASPD